MDFFSLWMFEGKAVSGPPLFNFHLKKKDLNIVYYLTTLGFQRKLTFNPVFVLIELGLAGHGFELLNSSLSSYKLLFFFFPNKTLLLLWVEQH